MEKKKDNNLTLNDYSILVKTEFADSIREKIADLGEENLKSKKPIANKVGYNDALVDVLETIKKGLLE